ncbi:hypothetical protein [Candidatus Neptunochlamydia vexilliferae]|uniref:Uncharacterized protein n=1 Tax=Candidatus Neptunichlamydia vexilliferae TaxID=1651774 RepID=A0ABS0AZ30_9BACT|nr:hypothetical protein [Candidatus Neptunochlamydia vexilliferae]MBF5059374.1 hypothetical protein [Candidatus Neptunochlamydia vexilliferae]
MDVKGNPHVAARAAAEAKKQEKSPPRRSFKDFLIRRERPRPVEQRRSVFDLASKNEKKKRTSDNAQGQAPDAKLEGAAESAAQIAEVSEISEEMAALIDKMANFVQLESKKGISTTTVSIGMEGSIFDGSEIVIDHYDTHPHSFNLQLVGNPEAMEAFSAHLSSLHASLLAHQPLQGFQIHLLPPVIGEKSKLYARGRSKEEKKKAAKINSGKKIPS